MDCILIDEGFDMTFWIFKLSEQEQYPDEPGRRYVYDNRHSVRVAAGDSYVFLDKRDSGYGFTGHGTVTKVLTSNPQIPNAGQTRIRTIYAAELGDSVQYDRSLDIQPDTVEGRKNRALLGIKNVNKLGWSRSIAEVGFAMFESIIDLAYRGDYGVLDADDRDFDAVAMAHLSNLSVEARLSLMNGINVKFLRQREEGAKRKV